MYIFMASGQRVPKITLNLVLNSDTSQGDYDMHHHSPTINVIKAPLKNESYFRETYSKRNICDLSFMIHHRCMLTWPLKAEYNAGVRILLLYLV